MTTPMQIAKSVIAETLELNMADIQDTDNIETIEQWDSLNHMRILMSLEERYSTTIDTEYAMEMFTVDAIANWISEQKSS